MMMPYPRALVAAAILCVAPLHNAAATAYKWVDESGETHYSQSPPTATKAQIIETPTSPVTAPPPTAKPSVQKPVDT